MYTTLRMRAIDGCTESPRFASACLTRV